MKVISLTENAKIQIRKLLAKELGQYKYIRLGIKRKGCAGASYKIEFAEKVEVDDELHKVDDINVLVDVKSLVYLIGLELDYKETELEAGFIFNNPNKKGSCGCGESFFI